MDNKGDQLAGKKVAKDSTSVIMTTREQRIQRVRKRAKIIKQGAKLDDITSVHKVVLIGDANVGKTSMLLRYSDNIFNNHPMSATIGVDFKQKNIAVDGKIVRMQFWDTAGQERFRSISQTYFRNCDGAIAVYDVTNRISFESLKQQVQNFLGSISKPGVKKTIQRRQPHQRPQNLTSNPAQIMHTDMSNPITTTFQENNGALGGSEKVPEISITQASAMLNNIIVVGTKTDLCKSITKNNRSTRAMEKQVPFQEVIAFCRKFQLSGCVEVSSSVELVPENKSTPFVDLHDVFLMSACNCVDQAMKHEMFTELVEIPKLAKLNKTFSYGAPIKATQAQSEMQIVTQVRLPANESFYSFKLQKREHTEYDGKIHRKPYPRGGGGFAGEYDYGYEDTTDFNRNSCC